MKQIIAAIVASSFVITSAYADSGTFAASVVLDNNGTLTLYELSNLGDSRHNPSGFSPSLDATGWGSTASPTPNIGTFELGTDTLNFKGGGLLTYKNGLSDVFGANIYYKIDGGSFSSAFSLGFNENLGGGDQRWYSEGSSVDLLSGLSVGTHSISVYLDASSSDGTHFANNGGADFAAEFNVIPEPAVMGFMVFAGAGTLIIRRVFML